MRRRSFLQWLVGAPAAAAAAPAVAKMVEQLPEEATKTEFARMVEKGELPAFDCQTCAGSCGGTDCEFG